MFSEILTFEVGEYEITMSALMPDFPDSASASSIFTVIIEQSCDDAELWVICSLASNLARDCPVTSNKDIYDINSSFNALTDGLYKAKLGVALDAGHSTCTQTVSIGETVYLTVELLNTTRVRTVDIVTLSD
jgi:hypothetical protein